MTIHQTSGIVQYFDLITFLSQWKMILNSIEHKWVADRNFHSTVQQKYGSSNCGHVRRP